MRVPGSERAGPRVDERGIQVVHPAPSDAGAGGGALTGELPDEGSALPAEEAAVHPREEGEQA